MGPTSLIVYALVKSGLPPDDPAIGKAVEYLRDLPFNKVYSVGLLIMALDALGGNENDAWIQGAATWLEDNINPKFDYWGYPKGTPDLSNTQYAVLGLRAATHMGYPVREQTWLGVIRYCAIVMEHKGPAGVVSLIRRGEAIPDEARAHLQNLRKVARVAGFRYSTLSRHDHVDGALTCAAITCLVVARHQLRRLESHKLNGKLKAEIDDMLATGWAWLQASWRMDRHPRLAGGRWYYYFLYSLERAAVLDAVKRVGGSDWYFEGAMQLLARQTRRPAQDGEAKPEPGDPKEESPDGAWNRQGAHETAPTCFALLFLKRGTAPLSAPITSTGK